MFPPPAAASAALETSAVSDVSKTQLPQWHSSPHPEDIPLSFLRNWADSQVHMEPVVLFSPEQTWNITCFTPLELWPRALAPGLSPSPRSSMPLFLHYRHFWAAGRLGLNANSTLPKRTGMKGPWTFSLKSLSSLGPTSSPMPPKH